MVVLHLDPRNLEKRRKRTKLIFTFFLLKSVQLISSFLQLTTYNLGSGGFVGFFWSSSFHFSIQERDGSLFLKVSKKKDCMFRMQRGKSNNKCNPQWKMITTKFQKRTVCLWRREQQAKPSVNFSNLKTIYKQRVQGYWGVKLNFQETYKKG